MSETKEANNVVNDIGKLVHVKPINRYSWLPDGHDGQTRYTGCAEFLCIQINIDTRALNTGLTADDEKRLEKALKLDVGTLSRFNFDYWGDYKKTIRIPKEGIVLNLDNPSDELTYLNLLAHSKVANSEQEKFENPEYEYVMTTPQKEAEVKNTVNKKKREAYKVFGKMSTSESIDVLKYAGKKTDNSHTIDMIESSIAEIIERDPQDFLDIVNDPDFKMKVFVKDCIGIKALVLRGTRYTINGGDSIGNTLIQAIEYLNDPINQDIYLDLKAKLEVAKKSK